MHRVLGGLSIAIIGLASFAPLRAPAAEMLATCDSPFMQRLLSTPMHGSPREMVFVLEVFDRVAGTYGCARGNVDLFSRFLERAWTNDVIGAQIPTPETVADAIRIEEELGGPSGTIQEKLLQRAHTRSFAVELRQPTDALPDELRNQPQWYAARSPNVWLLTGTAPSTIAVGMAFTNITQRAIYWPPSSLSLRPSGSDQYIPLSCNTLEDSPRKPRGREIAPSQRFVVLCQISQDHWQSDEGRTEDAEGRTAEAR